MRCGTSREEVTPWEPLSTFPERYAPRVESAFRAHAHAANVCRDVTPASLDLDGTHCLAPEKARWF